jgi:glycosyltransferase involved in cell wall biosynthesis
MKIVFFTHPNFSYSQSMPRFAKMLINGMQARGHEVKVWTPNPVFFKLKVRSNLRKWLGYVDQYLIFPVITFFHLKECSEETIFVFSDNALGPWVPLVNHKPHVIHCHDFLAQISALGKIDENQTSWTGKIYQRYIRQGFMKGKNFISVSHSTKIDLHKFLPFNPDLSEVIYNGLNQDFSIQNIKESRSTISEILGIDLEDGFILHVGGNQWYKNRTGVIQIYNAWRSNSETSLPLLLIGQLPNDELIKAYENSPFKNEIFFISGLNDDIVKLAYSAACLFLFPSLAEGFGWPIAEAMASGCPVITTNKAPMIEVGGNSAIYISRCPSNQPDQNVWAIEGANAINKILNLNENELQKLIDSGLKNIERFNLEAAIDKIEKVYESILKKYKNK